MPAMSPTMTEGGISLWKKKEGDFFAAGDVLVEIVRDLALFQAASSYSALQETDKATIDVEAQDDGVLAKIVANDGAKNIPVGSPIAIIGEQGDDLSGAAELAKHSSIPSPHEDPSTQTGSSPPSNTAEPGSPSKTVQQIQAEPSMSVDRGLHKGDRIFASPIAKKIAIERGIPLAQLKGSGPEGRIVRSDVESYIPRPSATTTTPATYSLPTSILDPPYTDIPVSNMRRTIGQRLSKSKQEVPHYYVTIEIDMGRLLKLREVFNQKLDKPDKLSVNDFVVKGAALALRDVPEANSAWLGENIRQYVVTFLPTPSISGLLQVLPGGREHCRGYTDGSHYTNRSRCHIQGSSRHLS
jgi:pyruvate dehydrogenase E2 component (dihydrolipoyllysine-residue acetyltransferase)